MKAGRGRGKGGSYHCRRAKLGTSHAQLGESQYSITGSRIKG
jgi:hypothetical protein